MVEQWNESSWTEIADLNSARSYGAAIGETTTAALLAGGENPVTNKTEEWNGTSWTEVADFPGSRAAFEGTGPAEAGIVFGGYDVSGSPNAATFEWSSPVKTAKVITD